MQNKGNIPFWRPKTAPPPNTIALNSGINCGNVILHKKEEKKERDVGRKKVKRRVGKPGDQLEFLHP